MKKLLYPLLCCSALANAADPVPLPNAEELDPLDMLVSFMPSTHRKDGSKQLEGEIKNYEHGYQVNGTGWITRGTLPPNQHWFVFHGRQYKLGSQIDFRIKSFSVFGLESEYAEISAVVKPKAEPDEVKEIKVFIPCVADGTCSVTINGKPL